MTPDRDPMMDNIMSGRTHKDGGARRVMSFQGLSAEHSLGQQKCLGSITHLKKKSLIEALLGSKLSQ